MKKIIFLILFLPTYCFCQKINSTTHSGDSNIYNDAIKRFISFTSKSDKTIYDTLILFKDDMITDSLQSVILNSKIVFADSAEISCRLHAKTSFVANRILPLNFDNGYFYVNIIPFVVRMENNGIVLFNTGTCIVSYTFNAKTKSFEFYRTACSGL